MGGNSTRVLALPEGLSFGPTLPGAHLAEGKCKSWPASAASPCTQDRTRTPGRSPPPHTLPPAPPAARKSPWAISPRLSFSAAFLGRVVYFQCLHLLASLSLFQSLRSGSPPPTPQGLPLSRSPCPLCPWLALLSHLGSLQHSRRLTTSPLALSSSLALKAVPLHDFSCCPRGTLCWGPRQVPLCTHLWHDASPRVIPQLSVHHQHLHIPFWCLSDLYSSFLLVSSVWSLLGLYHELQTIAPNCLVKIYLHLKPIVSTATVTLLPRPAPPLQYSIFSLNPHLSLLAVTNRMKQHRQRGSRRGEWWVWCPLRQQG